MISPAPKPPARAVLRLAGVLTQLVCAACLLLGTIAFVLVQQNGSGGSALAIGWGLAAMIGLVVGGLMSRGGLIAVIGSALIDVGFGIALLVFDYDDLRGILRVLPASDVDMIADALTGAGGAMMAIGLVCVGAIPQALRYVRWLRDETQPQAAGSTARGYPPPPISATQPSIWHIPPPPEEHRSRRRMYFALAGFAIGFGAGIGVLVSSTTDEPTASPRRGGGGGSGSAKAAGGGSGSAGSARAPGSGAGTGSGSAAVAAIDVAPPGDAGAALAPPPGDAGQVAVEVDPPASAGRVEAMLAVQRTAIAQGDARALAATVAPGAFAFGIDADEVVEGRDAIEAQIRRDLGAVPPSGFTLETRAVEIGEHANHAWIAEELELDGGGGRSRRLAITELAAVIDGKWLVVAWHWAELVRDDAAARMAVLGTKPKPRPVPNAVDGPRELDAAVREAFSSRKAFIEARSERSDAFNFGSAPGERVAGGARVKQVFTRFRATLRLQDNVRAIAAGAWDPGQRDAPRVAFAAANVDVTLRTRAATELTQTFRVLAILLSEDAGWRIVQTHWSHGGPIR